MQYFTAPFIAAFASLCAIANSAAIENAIAKRQGAPAYTWKNPKAHGKGNIGIGFGDQTIRFGTVSPDSLVHQMTKYCVGKGGACVFDHYSQNGEDIVDYGEDKITVTVNYEESFFPPDDAQTMINALGAAVASATKTHQACAPCGCPNDYCYNPEEGKKMLTLHTAPNYWEVIVPDPKNPNGAAPKAVIQVSISAKEDDSGFCSTFDTVGVAAAGAVGGVVGGPLGSALLLAGLVCIN